jgi:hypothetical protein
MNIEEAYKQGEDDFGKSLSPHGESPYPFTTKKMINLRNAWFDGYRNAGKKYFNEKYQIPELQKAIRKLIADHGLEIEIEPEYDTPYARTPEGYVIAIAEDEDVI